MVKHSWLRFLQKGILFILLGFCLIELTRIVETKISLDWMASKAIRYAASLQYSLEFCRNPASLEYAVRLLKTENIITNAEELVEAQRSDCVVIKEQPNKDSERVRKERIAIDAATRYHTIQAIMWEAAPNIINSRFLQSTICSDRPGFIYVSSERLCYPMEDVGNGNRFDGSKVMISLTYSYQLGSSIGLNLLEIPFYVFKEGSLEKFRLR